MILINKFKMFQGSESGNSRGTDAESTNIINDLSIDGNIDDCLTKTESAAATLPSPITSNIASDQLWHCQSTNLAQNKNNSNLNSKLSLSSDIVLTEHLKDAKATSAPANASNILYTSSISLLSNAAHRCGSEYASKLSSTMRKDK